MPIYQWLDGLNDIQAIIIICVFIFIIEYW